MTYPSIATILLVSCLAALSSSIVVNSKPSGTPPVPTPADQVSLLRGHRTTRTLAQTISRNDFGSWGNKMFKCQVLNALYQNAMLRYPNTSREVLSPRMAEMLNNCSSRELKVDDILNQQFMFPGTNWCGQGNVAENYHDLGLFNETDACCRAHDYCDDIIRPGRTKHNLVNPYATTRLHCECDDALRKCFREVDSIISNTLGYIFFSLLQTQCFELNYPASDCLLWRRGAVRSYCVKYKLEEDQPKKWQWFDQEPYF